MHHASQERENEHSKSVVLAILVIVALFTAIGVALMRAPKVTAAVVEHEPGVEVPTRSRPELVRAARERRPGNPRSHWAQDHHRRLRAKGQTCAVSTRGELDRILVFSWTRANLDREHMKQLQRVEGLYAELRSLGFTRMVEEVDGAVIWSKEL